MRFRRKVIIINIAFISLALGILGSILIYSSYNQVLQTQTSFSIEENTLIQSSIEYRLLRVINESYYDLTDYLISAGKNTSSQVVLDNTVLYIIYDSKLIYASDNPHMKPLINYSNIISQTFIDAIEPGNKKYITVKNDKTYNLLVASHITLNKKELYIITKRDVTNTYDLLQKQIIIYLCAMILILMVCSFILYFICKKLTKPLEILNKVTDEITNGDYSKKVAITSDDEVGMLAEKFNTMTLSISSHIDTLNSMIKAREQFVADFTHEIKTPMTTIIGYADTLRTRELSNERKQIAYNYIFSEGKRLENMSKKLFDLLYYKDSELDMNKLSTLTIANEIKLSMQPILDTKNINLILSVEDSIIFGEKELIKTVFINIIDNARKASSEGSDIYFNGIINDNHYVFEIIDTGCGMSKKTIEHICDEFYMADKSRSRIEGGAGLGMSLVSIIVKRHDATLNIESTQNVGTTIRITFETNN